MAVSLLVADDDDLLRNLVKEVLEDEGVERCLQLFSKQMAGAY